MKSSLGTRSKDKVRRLRALTGELALRGRIVVSSSLAKKVKRFFLVASRLEKGGRFDKLKGLLFISQKAIRVTGSKTPFLMNKKVLSRHYKLRNDSTRLMELKTLLI